MEVGVAYMVEEVERGVEVEVEGVDEVEGVEGREVAETGRAAADKEVEEEALEVRVVEVCDHT